MGRKRSKPEFDAGAAAIHAFEELTGEMSPDENWRKRYFILDARRDLENLRDRVEELEGEVDDLEMMKEENEELKERNKDLETAVESAAAALEEVKDE